MLERDPAAKSRLEVFLCYSGLSEALAAVATEVSRLRDRVQRLEGSETATEPLSASLQRIMEDIDYQI